MASQSWGAISILGMGMVANLRFLQDFCILNNI